MRKFLKRSLIVMAALLGLAVVLAGAALLWLRTDSGMNFVLDKVKSALAEQGLTLKIGRVEGPLPFRLYAESFSLSDEKGPLIRGESVELSVRYSSLFSGVLELPVVSLQKPELIRLPEIESASLDENDESASSSELLFPISILLGNLDIRDGILYPTFLGDSSEKEGGAQAVKPFDSAADGGSEPGSEVALTSLITEPYAFSASGVGSLSDGKMNVNLKASLHAGERSGVLLYLRSGIHAGQPLPEADRAVLARLLRRYAGSAAWQEKALSVADNSGLDFLVLAGEAGGGIVSSLTDDPHAPPFMLFAHGTGPLNDWKAEVHMLVGTALSDAAVEKNARIMPQDGQSVLPRSLVLNAELSAQAGNDLLFLSRITRTSWKAALSLDIRQAEFDDATLDATLSDGLRLSLEAEGNDAGYVVRLGEVRTPAICLDIPEATYSASGELRAALQVQLQEKSLLGKLGLGEAAAYVPDNALLKAEVLFTPGDSASVKGSLSGTAAKQDETLGPVTFAVRGQWTEDRFDLPEVRVRGDGLAADFSGSYAESVGGIMASLAGSFHSDEQAGWQELVPAFRRLDMPLPSGSGSLDVSLGLYQAGFATNTEHTYKDPNNTRTEAPRGLPERIAGWSGGVVLKAENIVVPSIGYVQPAGERAEVDIMLDTPAAGEFRLGMNSMRAGPVHMAGDMTLLTASDGISLAEAPQELLASRLKGDLQLQLDDLGLVLPDSFGKLSAELKAGMKTPEKESASNSENNRIGQPEEHHEFYSVTDNLALDFLVNGSSVRIVGNDFTELRAALRMRGGSEATQQEKEKAPNFQSALHGQLQLAAASSPAGSFSLSVPWRVGPNAQTGAAASPFSRVQVGPFEASAAGARAVGTLDALLDGGTPLLGGQIHLAVQDWAQLNRLMGTAFSGSSFVGDIHLTHDGAKQNATADISLPFLQQGAGANETVVIKDLRVKVIASDILQKLALKLDMGAAAGHAGLFVWDSAQAHISGDLTNTAFSIAMKATPPANETPARRRSNNRTVALDPTESLRLEGVVQASARTATLRTFILAVHSTNTGVKLRAPVTVAFGKDFSLSKTSLDIVPGGLLEAEAALSSNGGKADVTLRDLPFAVARIFTNAYLPRGRLDGDIHLIRKDGEASGSMALALRLPASGLGGQAAVHRAGVSGMQSHHTQNAATTGDARADINHFPLEMRIKAVLGNGGRPEGPSLPGFAPQPGISRLYGSASIGMAQGYGEAPVHFMSYSLPVGFDASGLPFLPQNALLAASIRWNQDVAPLWAMLPMADRDLTGYARIDADLRGTLAAPQGKGNLYLAEGRYEDKLIGVLLTNVNLEAHAVTDKITALLRAEDGQKGYAAMQAELTGLQPQSGGMALNMRAQINHLQPVHRDDLSELVLSGVAAASGPLSSLHVTSDIIVEQGRFNLLNLAGGSVPTLDVVEKNAAPQESAWAAPVRAPEQGPSGDIRIRIPARFYVEGHGLHSEWGGDLRVTGALASPSISGNIHPVRGYFNLLSKDFNFTGGQVSFGGGNAINPALNLELTYEGPDITALMSITGTATKPGIKLSSKPALPEDQILSAVLFGKDMSQLSRMEVIQVAAAVRELAGMNSGGFNPIDTAKNILGVDTLRIGDGMKMQGQDSFGAPTAQTIRGGSSGGASQESGGPTVEAGKYINDSIYVGVEQGITEDSTGVRVEMELAPNVNVQAKSTPRAGEAGIGWKKDY